MASIADQNRTPGMKLATAALIREGCIVEMEARALRLCVLEQRRDKPNYIMSYGADP